MRQMTGSMTCKISTRTSVCHEQARTSNYNDSLIQCSKKLTESRTFTRPKLMGNTREPEIHSAESYERLRSYSPYLRGSAGLEHVISPLVPVAKGERRTVLLVITIVIIGRRAVVLSLLCLFPFRRHLQYLKITAICILVIREVVIKVLLPP